ncbi:hypothetical protein N7504_004733 [Penicillium tannophilum]|nr:hypothetical protein N7504_004733 [Penicillium tannophilum]
MSFISATSLLKVDYIILYRGRLWFTDISICLVAYKKAEATQPVRDHAVMRSDFPYLIESVFLLKFKAIAPKVVWGDYFKGGDFVATEDCGLSSQFHLDHESTRASFGQSELDKRQKLANVISVRHNID